MKTKEITLADVGALLDCGMDIYDDEIDAGFYLEPEEMTTGLARLLNVKRIGRDHIVCSVTDLLRHHAQSVRRYLLNNYYEGKQLDYLLEILTTGDDITRDGGEAVYHFIENDICDFFAE